MDVIAVTSQCQANCYSDPEGIDRFLRGRSDSTGGDESRPSERKDIIDVPRNDSDTLQKVSAMVERSDRAGRTGGGRVVRI
jgi:hypothetical protein